MSGDENIIYGVDLSKKVTPIMVRDAIIDCFVQAHDDVLNQIVSLLDLKVKGDVSNFKYDSVVSMIQNIFEEIDADFDNPTKQDLIQVCDKLKKFATMYRDMDIIKKHYSEIMQLMDKL